MHCSVIEVWTLNTGHSPSGGSNNCVPFEGLTNCGVISCVLSVNRFWFFLLFSKHKIEHAPKYELPSIAKCQVRQCMLPIIMTGISIHNAPENTDLPRTLLKGLL